MRSLQTYWTILNKKGLLYSLHEGWKAFFPWHITHEKEEWDLIFANNTYRYFERHYKKFIHDYPEVNQKVPKKIWLLWLQGFDNAPSIVKQCRKSVAQFAPEYEIICLDQNNMLDYVQLPQFILQAKENGKLPFTQFSDILRTALLVEHGGIWMDATVLLTGSLPEYITKGSLFLFKSPWALPGKVVASNNFMAACPHHPIFENQLQLLYCYWKHECFLRDYMIYHLLFALVVRNNQQAKRLYTEIPYVHNIDYHTMMFRMFEPYSDKLWNEITQRSSIHKLTYKSSKENLSHTAGTIYEYILNL